jgi:flagellar hook protein FlgE
MSISAVMRTATSGMGAQSNRLGTVADNIANANTNGYKRANCEFSSFIPNRSSTAYESGSVMTNVRNIISEQGNLTYTTSTTDLAVSGNGFFLVNNTDEQTFLTRAGSFVKDGNGDLVNAAGYYLLGYPITNGVAVDPVANGTEGLERVRLTDLVMEAQLSTEGKFYVNVPSTADVTPAGSLPSDNVAGSEYTAKTSMVVYANLGNKVTLDLYWAKTDEYDPSTGTGTDTWELTAFNRADATDSGFPYTGTTPLLGSVTLTFDHTTGKLDATSPTDIAIAVPDGGALTLDLAQCSQLAHAYTVVNAQVDGSGPSAVDRVEFSPDGVLYAIYENGAQAAVYNIPLATVPSPDKMTPLPGDTFVSDYDSGEMLIGSPGQGGFGTITGSALEQSTVDLAGELADMIEAQRHYEMNSKVFQTGADILDVIVNLKR